LDDDGILAREWRRVLPRITDQLLDAVVYMYASEEDARAGIRTGGSGFLATLPIPGHEPSLQWFVVTNRHVVDGGFTVARMTSREEDVVVRNCGPAESWSSPDEGDDLAVWPLQSQVGTIDSNPSSVAVHHFVKDNWPNVGVGDECVMLGRFMGLDGLERNVPTARFGNVSMRPVPAQAERTPAEFFYVETRSQAGFSGSPVFVYYEITNVQVSDAFAFSTHGPTDLRAKVHEHVNFYLLGVDSSHLPRVAKAYQRNPRKEIPLDYDIEIGSGILEVVPAWKLRRLLEREVEEMAKKL